MTEVQLKIIKRMDMLKAAQRCDANLIEVAVKKISTLNDSIASANFCKDQEALMDFTLKLEDAYKCLRDAVRRIETSNKDLAELVDLLSASEIK